MARAGGAACPGAPTRQRVTGQQVESVDVALAIADLDGGSAGVVELHWRGLGDAARGVVEERAVAGVPRLGQGQRRSDCPTRSPWTPPRWRCRLQPTSTPASRHRAAHVRACRHFAPTLSFAWRQASEGSPSWYPEKRQVSEYSAASPVASGAMSAGLPPTGAADQSGELGESEDPTPADRGPAPPRRCTRPSRDCRLRAATAWNFLAAFTHLGDRYGPYHPGASALSDALAADRAEGRRTGPLDRLRPRRDRGGRPAEGEKTDLEEAMGHVVEAFRFLSARVETLEARLAAQDRPVDGAAWLVPAASSAPWPDRWRPTSRRARRAGSIVHADCGEGDLLRALRERGARGARRRAARCGGAARH